ncbi:MAG: hypothetical protein V4530_06990 [Pseudomonadota bacterium]
MSPDGTKAARWHYGPRAVIEIAGVSAPGRVEIPNPVSFQSFSLGRVKSVVALGWAPNSTSLWSVDQAIVKPSSFSITGLRPIKVSASGQITPLPLLEHAAGPLDAIQWIGNRGLALAQFGTRGNYYRPEHPDIMPTIAIVDAATGRVRSSFRADRIPGLPVPADKVNIRIRSATATLLKDGRARSVIEFSGWGEAVKGAKPNETAVRRHAGARVVWTEGEVPRVLTAAIEGSFGIISPDGSTLLVTRRLQPLRHGPVRECYGMCTPEPPPTPVEGVLVENIDIASGRVLWSVAARAAENWNQARPAISPDGRYAILGIPAKNGREYNGLFDMRDGRIVQAFSLVATGSYDQAYSFSPDSRHLWITCNNTIVRYRLGGN